MHVLDRASVTIAAAWLVGCTATVRAGLSEPEANQIVAALDQSAIAATKTAEVGANADRYRVDVGSGQVTRAIRVIEARHLPKSAAPGFDALYRESGVLATPEEERARWAAATAGELSRTLERLPGVQDARVHIALPEGVRALDDERPLPKASTLLRRRHDAAPVDESQVRALVAGAVQGLTQERVTIVQVASDAAVIERPTLTSVGPIAVTRQSARTLKGLLGIALGLDLVMAVALVAVVRKRRRHAGDSLSNAAG